VRLIPELLITFSERLWQQSCDEGKVIRDVEMCLWWSKAAEIPLFWVAEELKMDAKDDADVFLMVVLHFFAWL
jgi:hypothetical protein